MREKKISQKVRLGKLRKRAKNAYLLRMYIFSYSPQFSQKWNAVFLFGVCSPNSCILQRDTNFFASKTDAATGDNILGVTRRKREKYR